ncbi:hypothetical protein HMPREF1008_01052 [Olsenella sp. oral taxon 809 str. F0356]|uniref:energy-coupling factor transporter transmembrane component T n=1 Tax=Olsenella sp. oral taxon 809 TaxID=661086 RepID=UPI000231EDE5|nr:energy-coupling factor transporter transmembrane component T [Olsenella sp. oral taxon 809]EHF01957.1 hypothetical protein HMPREF1008_01052 [Olsenella sp. oral taxon 809 str. F0356]
MGALYWAGDGPLHRLPAGAKLLALLACSVAAATSPGWVAILLLVAAAAGHLASGFGIASLARDAWSIRWLVAFTVLAQAPFQGPARVVAVTGRIVSVVLLCDLLAYTTRATDLLRTLTSALGFLRPLGVDSARLGLLIMLAASAIPLARSTYAQARDAVAARGLSGTRALVAAAVPYLVMSVKRADELSEALDARGV